MKKIKSLEELNILRQDLRTKMEVRSIPDHPGSIIQIKVGMATCGIASGARPVFEYLKDELEKRNIPAMVMQTGCMCYCFAEPTVEVTVPGKEPVMFGYVNIKKADEIIERFIRKGEQVEGVIQMDFETINSI
jgi:NADP-reducing hydrogenase subunit HndB